MRLLHSLPQQRPRLGRSVTVNVHQRELHHFYTERPLLQLNESCDTLLCEISKIAPRGLLTMEVEDRITINEAFASKYEKKKRAEELSKCEYPPEILQSLKTL